MQPPNKYSPVAIILMLAGPIFGLVALKWPQYLPALFAAIVLAKYIAIFTHKPGAEQVIAQLQQKAAEAAPSNVTNIVEAPKS